MNQTLSKYHHRSPRYILQAEDNTLIRVAGPQQTPWEEATEIQNISLSGLAFTAPSDLCPMIGELIRIQFEVPGRTQMACHGLVTRLEKRGSSEMKVAVEFRKLEMSHRIVLAQAIARKMQTQILAEQESKKWTLKKVLKHKKKSILIAALALVAWCVLFYVLSTIFVST